MSWSYFCGAGNLPIIFYLKSLPTYIVLYKNEVWYFFFTAQYKEMGYLPQAMVNYLTLLGWGDGTENEFFTIDDLGLFLIFFFLSFSLQFF
jgi:hypothetical protein